MCGEPFFKFQSVFLLNYFTFLLSTFNLFFFFNGHRFWSRKDKIFFGVTEIKIGVCFPQYSGTNFHLNTPKSTRIWFSHVVLVSCFSLKQKSGKRQSEYRPNTSCRTQSGLRDFSSLDTPLVVFGSPTCRRFKGSIPRKGDGDELIYSTLLCEKKKKKKKKENRSLGKHHATSCWKWLREQGTAQYKYRNCSQMCAATKLQIYS